MTYIQCTSSPASVYIDLTSDANRLRKWTAEKMVGMWRASHLDHLVSLKFKYAASINRTVPPPAILGRPPSLYFPASPPFVRTRTPMMRPATRSSRSTRLAPLRVHQDEAQDNDFANASGKSTNAATKRPEKGKKPRHRMTNRQLEHLEALYQKATHPSRLEKEALAVKVGM